MIDRVPQDEDNTIPDLAQADCAADPLCDYKLARAGVLVSISAVHRVLGGVCTGDAESDADLFLDKFEQWRCDAIKRLREARATTGSRRASYEPGV